MPKSNLSIYLESGFTEEFYGHLERLTMSRYRAFRVDDSFDYFYDCVRSQVEDLLMQGVYDPAKGNFITFVCAVIRNEATKVNSKNSHRILVEDNSQLDIPGACSDGGSAVQGLRQDFYIRAEQLGVTLDVEDFEADLHQNRLTPAVMAYLWLLQQGGCHGLRV
jgi:hypothetical protein